MRPSRHYYRPQRQRHFAAGDSQWPPAGKQQRGVHATYRRRERRSAWKAAAAASQLLGVEGGIVVPSSVIASSSHQRVVDALPRNAIGKVLKGELRERVGATSAGRTPADRRAPPARQHDAAGAVNTPPRS
jgi:hypothetical protein